MAIVHTDATLINYPFEQLSLFSWAEPSTTKQSRLMCRGTYSTAQHSCRLWWSPSQTQRSLSWPALSRGPWCDGRSLKTPAHSAGFLLPLKAGNTSSFKGKLVPSPSTNSKRVLSDNCRSDERGRSVLRLTYLVNFSWSICRSVMQIHIGAG